MATMVFHAAYPFDPQSVSASAIRPRKMYQAFRSLGYEVLDVTGFARERRKKIKALRQRVAMGQKVDFLYSESSTIPPFITEKKHLPPHFFLDIDLFRWCGANGIPTGVFYRDIYWKFSDWEDRVGPVFTHLLRPLYRAELAAYSRYCSRIFLPSEEMLEHLPELSKTHCVPLPPGGEITEEIPRNKDSGELSLFYVGGIGVHYRLHNLVQAVTQVPGVRLTLCTDAARWEAVRDEYPQAHHPQISVVHESGEGLDPLYAQADICCVAVEPHFYWEFASPVKVYEYIGRGKPLLATTDTLPGKLVDDHGLGWVSDNSVAALSAQLARLRDNRELVNAATNRVRAIRSEHTWQARARTVARELTY